MLGQPGGQGMAVKGAKDSPREIVKQGLDLQNSKLSTVKETLIS